MVKILQLSGDHIFWGMGENQKIANEKCTQGLCVSCKALELTQIHQLPKLTGRAPLRIIMRHTQRSQTHCLTQLRQNISHQINRVNV